VSGNPGGPLVVVPCGRAKAWARNPDLGPTPARHAYVGGQFSAARRYAEAQSSGWVILSAKYGFIAPDTLIENYDVAFSKLINGYYRPVEMPGQVSPETLRAQAEKLAAEHAGREVVCLVADAYRLKIETAFAGLPVTLSFPIAGKRQHAMMAWLAAGVRKSG
ncbi:MAG: DUF6884 domain-containing protein, partial [Blastocatellia bacterium]